MKTRRLLLEWVTKIFRPEANFNKEALDSIREIFGPDVEEADIIDEILKIPSDSLDNENNVFINLFEKSKEIVAQIFQIDIGGICLNPANLKLLEANPFLAACEEQINFL